MTIIIILIFSILFEGILQFTKLNKYNFIIGMAIFDDYIVAKAILAIIGIGAILLSIEAELGFVVFRTKPFIIVGIIPGGLIFGAESGNFISWGPTRFDFNITQSLFIDSLDIFNGIDSPRESGVLAYYQTTSISSDF